jgi:hypothetical protein
MAAFPSDHKIVVGIKPIGGINLSDCDFTVNLFVYTNRKLSIPKDKCIRKDDGSYFATFNTKDLGKGNVMMSLNIRIPDADFEDGFKNVNTKPICTGVADI